RGRSPARGPRPTRAPGAPGSETPIEFDPNREGQPPQENPLNLPVIGGDAIVVNRGQYFVDGWVEKPGAYDLSPGTTAMGGLTAAGGAMYPADLHGITVWRAEPGGTKKRIDVGVGAGRPARAPDPPLQSGHGGSGPAPRADSGA